MDETAIGAFGVRAHEDPVLVLRGETWDGKGFAKFN